MAHTPGPWAYDGKFTVTIPTADGDLCFRSTPENAKLIAAAPELLEALQNLVYSAAGGADEAGCHLGITTRAKCLQCQRVDAARAAIQKAVG
jgi:hypothetical protein